MLKNSKSNFNPKLTKFQSDSKIRYIYRQTNKSPTKNVPSIGKGAQRFLKLKSFTPNLFYNLPECKSQKATSFGFGTKTNFAKKEYLQPTRYKISSSFDLRLKKGPSFGISREDFYKSKEDKSLKKIAPGLYNLHEPKLKSFYMGKKLERKDQTESPGPAAYDVLKQTLQQRKQCKNHIRIKAPRIKTEYFEKASRNQFNNEIPGPGSYQLVRSSGFSVLSQRINTNSRAKLPQNGRFYTKVEKIPGPGQQQVFHQVE